MSQTLIPARIPCRPLSYQLQAALWGVAIGMLLVLAVLA